MNREFVCLDDRNGTKRQAEIVAVFKDQHGSGALVRQALLHAGYEGLMAHRNRIPAHATLSPGKAAESLVRLYEALEQHGEAARWRQILAEQASRSPREGTSSEVK